MTDFRSDIIRNDEQDRHDALHVDADNLVPDECGLCQVATIEQVSAEHEEHWSDIVMDCPLCKAEWDELTRATVPGVIAITRNIDAATERILSGTTTFTAEALRILR